MFCKLHVHKKDPILTKSIFKLEHFIKFGAGIKLISSLKLFFKQVLFTQERLRLKPTDYLYNIKFYECEFIGTVMTSLISSSTPNTNYYHSPFTTV